MGQAQQQQAAAHFPLPLPLTIGPRVTHTLRHRLDVRAPPFRNPHPKTPAPPPRNPAAGRHCHRTRGRYSQPPHGGTGSRAVPSRRSPAPRRARRCPPRIRGSPRASPRIRATVGVPPPSFSGEEPPGKPPPRLGRPIPRVWPRLAEPSLAVA